MFLFKFSSRDVYVRFSNLRNVYIINYTYGFMNNESVNLVVKIVWCDMSRFYQIPFVPIWLPA